MDAIFPRAIAGYVGRQTELSRALSLASNETLHLLYGVAGIGKTEFAFRIVEELATQSRWQSARRVWLSIQPGSTTEVLVATALVQLGGRAGSERRDDGDLEVLARALEGTPTILFLDDVHHLDPATAGRMLGYLSRRVRNSRLLVASRIELALPDDAPAPAVHRLGPFDRDDTAALVSELVGRLQIHAPDATDVYTRTGGSPFLILRDLAANGDYNHVAFEQTLESLDPDARATLDVLACARTAITNAELTSVGGKSLRELSRRFLIEQRQSAVTAHDLILDAARRQMSAAAGVAAHRKLAALYHQRPGSAIDYVEIIHHLVRGEMRREGWDACQRAYHPVAVAGLDHLLLEDLAILHADLPEVRFEITLARTRILLRRSLVVEADALLTSVKDLTSSRWLLQAGEVARRRARIVEAEAAFRSALEQATDRKQRVQSSLALADIASTRGNCEEARTILASTTPQGPREHARRSWSLALSYLIEERFAEAVVAARTASEAIEGQGYSDLELLLATHEIIGRCECNDLDGAKALHDAMQAMPTDTMVVGLGGVIEFSTGKLAAAVASLDRAFGLLTAHGDQIFAGIFGYYLVRAHLARGDIATGRGLAYQILRMPIAEELSTLTPHMRAVLAEALLESDLVSEARAEAAAALAAPKATDQTRWMATVVVARASVLDGDLVRARRELDSIPELAPAEATLGPAAVDYAPARSAAIAAETAWIALLGGDPDAAARDANLAALHFATTHRRADEARATAIRALALIAMGCPSGDELRLLERARSLGQECGHVRALALVALGQIALQNRSNPATPTHADGQHTEGRALVGAIDGVEPRGLATLLSSLGLVRRARYRVVSRSHSHVVAESELGRLRDQHHLVVEPARALITVTADSEQRVNRGRTLACELLGTLIESAEPVPAPTLFLRGWGGTDYHPLRHRNMLHVAIARLRTTLRALLGRDVIETTRNGWCLVADVDAIVIPPRARLAPATEQQGTDEQRE